MAETATFNGVEAANFRIIRPEIKATVVPMPTRQESKRNPGTALGRRADIALGSLEAGKKVLTIGSDILSDDQRQGLVKRGIGIMDESEMTESFDGTGSFDLVVGNLEVDELDNTLPTIAGMAANHADLYIDVYSPEPFAHNDVLDDGLRSHNFYLRGTQAESRGDTHRMQVDMIRNPRGEISKGIMSDRTFAYREGPMMERVEVVPNRESK